MMLTIKQSKTNIFFSHKIKLILDDKIIKTLILKVYCLFIILKLKKSTINYQ